jgi:hypothetical protein
MGLTMNRKESVKIGFVNKRNVLDDVSWNQLTPINEGSLDIYFESLKKNIAFVPKHLSSR